MKTKKKETPLEIFTEGLEACVDDGRGWNKEHEKARLLLEAAPDLLAAIQTLANAFEGAIRSEYEGCGSMLDDNLKPLEPAHAAIRKAIDGN